MELTVSDLIREKVERVRSKSVPARKLVRIIYYKASKANKYYLITPTVTVFDGYGYTMPVTRLDIDQHDYESLFDMAIKVMEKECRLPDYAEWTWIAKEKLQEDSKIKYSYHTGPLFRKREFKKEFGYHYGSLVKTATSIIMMEQLPDGAYVFEMWSTDGMTKEHITCPAGSSREEVIETLGKALKQSEANRAARPKYY